MNGVDKIIEKIISDTDIYENESNAKAELEKKEIIENAEEKSRIKAAEIIEKAEKDAEDELNRARSVGALEARKQLLKTKRLIIDEVFDKVEVAFSQLPKDKYVQLLGNIAASVNTGGELSFAVEDKKIADRVMSFLKNKNINNFTLSEKCETGIKKGFIIKNGAVKINYSIKSIIENMRADLEPEIAKMLFSAD